MRAYCEDRGWDEPVVVAESASAGKRLFGIPNIGDSKPDEDTGKDANRPKFLLLIGHITQVSNARLVVLKLDRFSRFSDEMELMYQLLKRHGVELHSTMAHEETALQTEDPNDPMGALIRQIFGAFAQYERATIEMRMTSGLRFKAARGGFTGGTPPYGYDLSSTDLKVNEYRAQIVRYVFMLRVHYGWSQRAIARYMQQIDPDPNPDVKWSKMRIHRILKNEAMYSGSYRDRFGDLHERNDLRILTDAQHDYTEEFNGGQAKAIRSRGSRGESEGSPDGGTGRGTGSPEDRRMSEEVGEGQGVGGPRPDSVDDRERGRDSTGGGGDQRPGGPAPEGVSGSPFPL